MTNNRTCCFLPIIFLLALMFGCSANETKINTTNHVDDSMSIGGVKSNEGLNEANISEGWICDTILSLDEVRKESEFLEKETKGKRHLSVDIYRYPDSTNNYFWVKVWEDNGLAYATHFNFYVYPNQRKVLFYDTLNDTLLDLPTWSKSYKYFNFKQHSGL